MDAAAGLASSPPPKRPSVLPDAVVIVEHLEQPRRSSAMDPRAVVVVVARAAAAAAEFAGAWTGRTKDSDVWTTARQRLYWTTMEREAGQGGGATAAVVNRKGINARTLEVGKSRPGISAWPVPNFRVALPPGENGRMAPWIRPSKVALMVTM